MKNPGDACSQTPRGYRNVRIASTILRLGIKVKCHICWNPNAIDSHLALKRPRTDHAAMIGKQPSSTHVKDHLGVQDTNCDAIFRL
jgi:hypothetical protein